MTPEIEKRIKAMQAGRVPAGYCSVAGATMPKEWNLVKLGSIFGNRIDINHSDYELLSITADKGVIPRSSIADKDNSSEDKSKYKHICIGDIGYNTMRMWQGVCALSAHDGIVSPAYTILAPIEGICASYFAYLFKMQFMINLFYRNSQGLVDDTRCLKYEWFKNIEMKIPPIDEQKKIAEILATQDKVIELKENLIAEKQSQKKYLMSVLLGDDFKKSFKLNGVTIDKKKWEKKKIGDVCVFRDSERKPIKEGDRKKGIYPYYGASGIIDYVEDYIFDGSFILLGEDGANIIFRSSPLAFKVEGKIWVNNHAHILVPKEGNDIDFLVNRLESLNYEKFNTGTAQPKLNQDVVEKIEILMPTHPEQKAIADVLSAADEEISLLQKDLEQEKLKKKSLMQLLLTGLVRAKV